MNSMKIWHDNSGKNEHSSWFLKYIIIYDLQTREKFYTICENWLAVEKGDGKIERILIFLPKNAFKILKLKNESFKDIFSDLHLWLSVFKKPIGSLFTRLNRVTCFFLSFYLTMCLITAYYTTNYLDCSGSFLLNMGFIFNFTQEQVFFYYSYLIHLKRIFRHCTYYLKHY